MNSTAHCPACGAVLPDARDNTCPACLRTAGASGGGAAEEEIDGFVLRARLGTGGTGAVYFAEQLEPVRCESVGANI